MEREGFICKALYVNSLYYLISDCDCFLYLRMLHFFVIAIYKSKEKSNKKCLFLSVIHQILWVLPSSQTKIRQKLFRFISNEQSQLNEFQLLFRWSNLHKNPAEFSLTSNFFTPSSSFPTPPPSSVTCLKLCYWKTENILWQINHQIDKIFEKKVLPL